MKDTLPARVRFGGFELDLRSGELRVGDETTLLQEQPLRVLRMLVEREGELVTREEIKKRLWPYDTIVEFDHSINAVINNLRRALGDSADEPKYIETLARRGYRLMVPIERVSAEDSSGAIPTPHGELQPPALTGRTVSHYRVLDIIGGGGMGVVYRAEDLKLGRQVALKFLPEELGSDPQALQRFSREARAASSLDHPNICDIHEFGEHEGRPFIVMQLLEGQTLRDHLAALAADQKALPLDRLLEIAIQITDGLQAAHEKGIIHRDIKPANIFLTKKGTAKILDFGLAKLLELSEPEAEQQQIPRGLKPAAEVAAAVTRTGVAMGTAGYMSPEQVRGEKLDARTDLFCFGLVLYEMATGRRAFGGETEELVRDAILHNSPTPLRELNPTLPAKLVSIIDRALEKDRDQRYQSAAEMRADLNSVERDTQPTTIGMTVNRRWQLAATAALLIAVAASSWLYWRERNQIKLTDQDTIVLADFTNHTSDPVFDDALNTALQVELMQTPFLNVLGAEKVRGALKQMGHPEDTKLTPEVAREVCLRTNSKAVVEGLIIDAGSRYRIGLRATDCQSGKAVANTEVGVASRNQIVRVLGVAGVGLRRKLGEPGESLRRFDKPLEEATSSSPEVVQALVQGQRQRRLAASLPYFQRSVILDPNFARGYVALGGVYNDLGETALAAENVKRAFELRGRVEESKRLDIESNYYFNVTGELDKAIAVNQEWAQTYLGDSRPHHMLTFLLRIVGRRQEALVEALEARRLQPGSSGPIFNLMMVYIELNRFDDAKAAFEEASSSNQDALLLRWARCLVAFLQSDDRARQEQVKWALAMPELGHQIISSESDSEAYYGHLRKASALSRVAVQAARKAKLPEAAAAYLATEAWREAEIGNSAQARARAAGALALSSGRNGEIFATLAFAIAGDPTKAREVAKKHDLEFPLPAMVQGCSSVTIAALTAIGALMEIQKGNPHKALASLATVTPCEAYEGVYLHPAYVRGLAYLKAGEGHQAAREFQKILDHPGIVGNSILGALANLQVGRAQAMMGDKMAARKSYEYFLNLWKDADPGIPIYKQAKAEYAKLQ